MKILLVTVFAFLVFAQCPSQNADKELALKEKELELKEKELELKEKEKEKEDKKDEEKETKKKEEVKAKPEPKKSEAPKPKKSSGTKGCGITNRVQFKKGTSAQTFKCDLDTNSGNTKHRYTLQAEAGQDLTISFKSTDSNFDVTAPDGGGRVNGVKSAREQIPLNKDGKWIISVNLDSGSSFGDYTINFEIK